MSFTMHYQQEAVLSISSSWVLQTLPENTPSFFRLHLPSFYWDRHWHHRLSFLAHCDNHTLNSGYDTRMIHSTHLLGVIFMVGGVLPRESPSPHLWSLGREMCQFRTLVHWLGQLPWVGKKWNEEFGKGRGRGRKGNRDGGERGMKEKERREEGKWQSQRVKLKPKKWFE